jgi:hypothetical protein
MALQCKRQYCIHLCSVSAYSFPCPILPSHSTSPKDPINHRFANILKHFAFAQQPENLASPDLFSLNVVHVFVGRRVPLKTMRNEPSRSSALDLSSQGSQGDHGTHGSSGCILRRLRAIPADPFLIVGHVAYGSGILKSLINRVSNGKKRTLRFNYGSPASMMRMRMYVWSFTYFLEPVVESGLSVELGLAVASGWIVELGLTVEPG